MRESGSDLFKIAKARKGEKEGGTSQDLATRVLPLSSSQKSQLAWEGQGQEFDPGALKQRAPRTKVAHLARESGRLALPVLLPDLLLSIKNATIEPPRSHAGSFGTTLFSVDSLSATCCDSATCVLHVWCDDRVDADRQYKSDVGV